MRQPLVWAAVAGVAAALLAPDSGVANHGGVFDPREGHRALDISYAGHGHAGPDTVTQSLTTYDAFRSRLLQGSRSIAFALYPRYWGYPDRWVLGYWANGSLRAVVEDNDGNVIASVAVSRPSNRSVKVAVPKALFGDPPAYRWVAFTTGPSGTDATLESRTYETGAKFVRGVVHDYTAPDIRLISFPDPSTESSAGLTYPVAFAIRDTGFAGIRVWRLDRKIAGSSWVTIAKGGRAGTKMITLRGIEGATYDHRVVAVDRQGNHAQSPLASVSVPLDDANPALAGSFSPEWTAGIGSAGDFRGTLHVASTAQARFSYAFTGSYFAWIAPGSTGSADVLVDQEPSEVVNLDAYSAQRQVVFARSLPEGPHVVTITVLAGTVSVDGVVVHAGTQSSSGRVTNADVDGLLTPALAAPLARSTNRFAYADSWRGWPVAPLHAQHPIRGSFLDPRAGGFHFGIDINVRDDRPETGAPRGRTHRVYAVEGGVVTELHDGGGTPCGSRNLWVGHFAYYHVDAVVHAGQWVRPGQVIGWTCYGQWHVHLSEWIFAGGRRVIVNPLHPGGKVAPYVDSSPPIIHDVRFTRPSGVIWILPGGAMWSPGLRRDLPADRLRGRVDVRAWISDPQSFHGWFDTIPSLYADHMPVRVRVQVFRARDGTRVLIRTVFDGRRLLYGFPFNGLYAMGTMQNLSGRECVRISARPNPPRGCQGRYYLHLFRQPGGAYWNTRTLANGSYRLRITAWDALGNASTKTVPITIAN